MSARETGGKGLTRPLVTLACVICGVAALGLSVMTYMDVSMFGFPDGYVTDYQKAASTPLRVVMWLEAGLGVGLLALAFSPISTKVRFLGCLSALIGLVFVAVAAHVGIPWYFGTHLGLDSGIGG